MWYIKFPKQNILTEWIIIKPEGKVLKVHQIENKRKNTHGAASSVLKFTPGGRTFKKKKKQP